MDNGWTLTAVLFSSGSRVQFAEGRVHDGGGRYERSDCAFVAGDNEERDNQLDTVESSFIVTRVPIWNTRTKLKFVEKTTQEGRERTRWRHRFRKRQTTSRGNHDVGSLPASGDPRSRRRPPTRYTRCAQELLPRLQIMDPTCPNAPFRRHPVSYRGRPGIMEGDVSGSFNLSYVLRENSGHRLPVFRCRSGRLDQRVFSRRTLGGAQSLIPRRPRPIPRTLTRHQIPPHALRRPSSPMCF